MKVTLLSVLFLFVASPAWAAPAHQRSQPATGRPQARSSQSKTTTPKATAPRTPPQTRPTATKPPSQGQHGLFQRANQYYHEGNYREAAQLFEQLVSSGSWAHFAVFYNLGNCYARLQQYGMALAYYRKAERLRPNHLDLLHNIQLLYRRLGKAEPPRGGLRAKFLFWYYLLNLKQMFYGVILLTCLALFLWAAHIRRKTRGHFGLRWPLAALGTFTFILWFSLGIKLYYERYLTTGIIIQPRVTARSGYGDQFEPLFRLTEADEVTVKEKLEVTNPTGKQTWIRIEATIESKEEKRNIRQTGWIPADAVKEI